MLSYIPMGEELRLPGRGGGLLTATTRAGFQRHTFPRADQARILFVLNVPSEYHMAVQNAVIRRVSDSEILVIDLRQKASLYPAAGGLP
jgi:hypothetical protein